MEGITPRLGGSSQMHILIAPLAGRIRFAICRWAWWNECVDEACAILPPKAATNGFTPGFDFAQLKADLADVAS